MTGKRKFIIAILTTILMWTMYIGTLLFGNALKLDVTNLLIVIVSIFGSATAVFYGSNFGEHWAVVKGAQKPLEKNAS